jgi:DNA replication protein DnaC
LLKDWVQSDLLVVDDLLLARRATNEATEVLQAIVHQRYKLRRAIVVTSNRVVQDWGKYLGDVLGVPTTLIRVNRRA